MQQEPVGCFISDYNISDDQARRIGEMLLAGKPMHKNQKGLVGQAWLDEYARIVHQTSQQFKDDPVIVVPPVGEFLEYVAEINGYYETED